MSQDITIFGNFLSLCLAWLMCRQMKKYNKDFKQSLTCALLIMNRDNTLQHLRGPRETQLYDRSNGYGNFGKSKELKNILSLYLDLQIMY